MEISPAEISNLPMQAGCYLFRRREENTESILYIGKAKNLRARVRQYFIEGSDSRFFIRFIREQTTHIEYIATKDERDALILENELIKKHKPIYNISLKDDKRYLSLRLDIQHEWPRIEIVRKIKKDSAIYLGPFSSATRLKETLNIMQKVFPLRSCPDSKLYNRSRPCIEYDIKRCVAPCVNYCSKEDYQKLVDSVVLFLQGKSDELISQLEIKMEKESESESFEQAAKIRDQIEAVKAITQSGPGVINQKSIQAGLDADVFAISQEANISVVYALFVRGGLIWDQRAFEFSKAKLDESELLSQVLSRYYSREVYIPRELWLESVLDIPGLPGGLHALRPRTEEKLNFVETAKQNADARLQSLLDRKHKVSKVLDDLQSKLGLKSRPELIDCIDISHHHGSEVVASVVRFEQGLPEKSGYRKIRLSQDRIDDFASMREAISRRYKEIEDLPDLLVVDGGKGQLSSAEKVLKEKKFLEEIDLIGLAKARLNSEPIDPLNPLNRERIFKIGRKNPILLKEGSKEELLLTYLRDEAHRFAITYHRKKKSESISLSVLDEIKGISSRTKLRLLKEFGSVEAIQAATDYELLKIVRANALEALRERLSTIDTSDKSAQNMDK